MFRKLRKKSLLLALALNLVFLLVYLVFSSNSYAALDDFFMATVLEGAYDGLSDTHLFFVNSVYGFLLKPLYLLFPSVGWYYIFEVIEVFAAFTIFTYVLLKRLDLEVGLILSLILLCCVSPDFYFQLSFTQNGALLTASGVLLLLMNLRTPRRLWFICGLLLFVLGFVMRKESFLLGVPYVAFFAFLSLVKKVNLKILLITVLSSAVVLLGLYYFEKSQYIEPEYKYYSSYQGPRATFVDGGFFDVNAFYDELAESGYEKKNAQAIRTWLFYDTEIFHLDSLPRLLNAVENTRYELNWSRTAIRIVQEIANGFKNTSVWCWAVFCLLILFYPKKKLEYYPWVSLGIISMEILYLCMVNRLVYRVESGIWLYAIAFTIVYLPQESLSSFCNQWQKKVDGSGDGGDEDLIDDGDGDDGDDDYGDGGRYEDIEGANGDSYLPDLLEGMDYRCVVSDQYGNSARVYYYLSVENGLRAYPEGAEEGSDTVDIYIGLGDTVTLKVKAEALDDSCLTYRWRDNDWTQYETDRDVFVIKGAAESKEYCCEVQDQYGNWDTAYFNVVIENHLVAYPEGSEPDTYELDKPVPPLTPVSLKVVVQADDMNGLTYEWREQRGDEDVQTIEGANTDTYTIASVDHELCYTCVVRDRYNNTEFVSFHVYADNKLTAYPKGAGEGENYVFLYVGYGKPVTLRTIVSALYEDGITYEWYSNYFDVIEGASGKEFRVSSVTETAWYYCRVYDKFGNWVEVRFVLNVENHLKAYPEGYEGHDTTTIYAKPGSKVKLSAIVEADDQEGLKTTWRKRYDWYETFLREGKTITVNAEDEEYVFKAEDKYGNVERVSYIIKLSEDIPAVDISKATVTVKDDVYNGTERKPAVRVVFEGRVLTKGTDYTLSYKNNVKAGIRTAKAIVTGDNVTLSGKKEEAFSILPGKTARGDMFNLAGNVKVTWKAVPGAKYYKVYREGVTDASESVSEPVIVTSLLVGWDKSPGLVNGHAYRYRIVASLTGGSKSSGDSTQSYSKLMYRLKTVAIKRVKNTEPGKVKIWFDKTTSGDSYVLQYGEREDMVDAKTKVVQGAENTSYTIGGLKKGKTYYISIRVRKKVDGVFYYTTFGVAKKIRIEQ